MLQEPRPFLWRHDFVNISKKNVLLVLVVLLAVAGVVVLRTFRTTTTEVEAADAVDRLEQALDEEEQGDTTSAPADDSTTDTDEDHDADESGEPLTADEDESIDDLADPDGSEGGDTPESDQAETPDLSRLPDVGVYPIIVTGGEQLDLGTITSREYPIDGFVTVTPSACGVEIRTDFVLERWQSLEWCDTGSGLELGQEQIFHQFFGLDDLVVRTCTDSPLVPDATSWSCRSDESTAERAVTSTLIVADVAGDERSVLAFATTLVVGDHPDNVETIELWIDVETGLPVRESRIYDFTLDTPLGDAGYTETYEWAMTSLVPIG